MISHIALESITVSIKRITLPSVSPYKQYPAAIIGITNQRISPKFRPNSSSVTVSAHISANSISVTAVTTVYGLFSAGEKFLRRERRVEVWVRGIGSVLFCSLKQDGMN